MALYRLPDGKQLDIPDNASKEELIDIQNNLAKIYPDSYTAYDAPTERSVIGSIGEIVKGVPRGLASTVLSAGEGISSLVDIGNDSAAVNLFKDLQTGLNESPLGISEGYEDAFSAKLGQGLGSFGAFFIPGAAAARISGLGGKVLAGGAQAKAAQKALGSLTTKATLPLAVSVGVSEQAQNIEYARSQGEEVSAGQEIISELLGGGIGASEVYTVKNLLKGILKGPGMYHKIPQRIRFALATGSREAAQEALAGIAQDAVALGIYSDTVPLGESLFDDLTVGGAVGALSDLVFRGITRRSAGNSYLRDQAQETQKQEDERFEQHKENYDRAVADGSVILPSQVVSPEQQAIDDKYPRRVIEGDFKGTPVEALSDSELEQVAVTYQRAIELLFDDPKTKPLYEIYVNAFDGLKIEMGKRKGPSPVDDREVPILETHNITFNEDGTYNVVGVETEAIKGTYNTDEEARNNALRLDKSVRNIWTSTLVNNALKINGLEGNGTAYLIGQKLFDPLQNSFDAKVLANYDSRISKARKEQYKKQKGLTDKEKSVIDREQFYNMSNIMKDNMLRELLGPQVEAMTEAELSTIREQLDQIPDIFPIYKQKTRKGKDGKEVPLIGQFEASTAEDAARLEDITSQLSLFYDKVNKKGIDKKNFYTLIEAKKILKPDDFNALLKEKASVTFKISALLNENIGIRRNKKGDVDVTLSALKEALSKKNIKIELNSDAFKYFAKTITGTDNYTQMSKGQKELLIAKIATLPRFNVDQQSLPDYTPRPYTAKQIDDLYRVNIGQNITTKQIKEQVKNSETGKDLNAKEIQKLRKDLIESGRAIITKNRLQMTQDFDLQQARKANGLNETAEQLNTRLRNTTELQDEEIEDIVSRQQDIDTEIISNQELKLLPPPDNPEKYGKLLEEMRERLDALGLKQISLRFEAALKDSLRVKQDERGRYYFEESDGVGTYDRPMKTILASLEKSDPDGSLSEQELKDSIAKTIDHEAIHALIDLGLLTDKEIRLLKETAYRSFSKKQIEELRNNYSDLSQNAFEEELIAEMFAYYRADPDFIKGPKPKGIIENILQFFTTLSRTISNGFTTPTSVLTDISSGKIGARQRGKIRSLHKLDKELENDPKFLERINPPIGDVSTDRKKDIDRLSILDKAYDENIANYQRGRADKKVGDESNYKPDSIAGDRLMKQSAKKIKQINKKRAVLIKKLGGIQRDLLDQPTDRSRAATAKASRRIEEPIGKFKKIPDESFNVQGGKLYGYDVEIVQENVWGDKYQLYITDPRIVTAEKYKGVGNIGLSANNFTEAREEAREEMRRLIARGKTREAIPPYQDMYVLLDQPTDRLSTGFKPTTTYDPEYERYFYKGFIILRPQERSIDSSWKIAHLDTGVPEDQANYLDEAKWMIDNQWNGGMDFVGEPNLSTMKARLAGRNNPQDGTPFSEAVKNNIERTELEKTIAVAEFRVDQPTDRSPLSTSGIIPQSILNDGEVENLLLDLYEKNDTITPKQFLNLFKKLSPRSSKKHTFPSYDSLMADIQESIDRGLNSQWYKEWAVKIPTIVGDVNMNEFSKVFGITSAQATPEKNLKATLGVMVLAREVKNKNNIVDFNKSNIAKLKTALTSKQTEYFLSGDKIKMLTTLYETGQMNKKGSGMKTAFYAQQILADANNQFSPWSVIDRHMLTKLGFNTKSPTEIEYRMAQGMISLLTSEVYKQNGMDMQFDSPSAVQAILWAHERYGKSTATNEGSASSAIQYAKKETAKIDKMKEQGLFDMDHAISGKFISAASFKSKRVNNPFDSNTSEDILNAITALAPSVAFEFKMGVDRGYLPANLNLTFNEHLNYMENMLKDVTSGNQLRVLRRLGIPHQIDISAGTFENNLTPNIVLKLPGADKATVEGVAGLLTDAFLQDSAIISRPTTKGVHTGLLLSKPDNSKFSPEELETLMGKFSDLTRDREDINFTVLPSEQNSVMLIDPRSFGEENYETSDINEFLDIIQQATYETDYQLETYGQESELIQYKKEPHTKGTSRALRLLGNKASIIESSDLQRAIISDLYIPAFENYRRFARRHEVEPVSELPIYSRRSALYGQLNDQGILGRVSPEEWQARAVRKAEQSSRNHIPRINTQADPMAIAVAFQMAEGKSIDNILDQVNRDIPTDRRTQSKMPAGFEKASEDVGGVNALDKDFGSSMIDWADTKESASTFFQNARVALIDKLSLVEKKLLEAGEKSEKAKILLNSIDTNAMADLRFSERNRGVFAGMIKFGVPTIKDGGTYVADFAKGGLLEIFAPLYKNAKIDLESLFKIYAIAQRGTRLDANGIPTPVTQEVVDKAKEIQAQYPEVVEVYNNYQEWNNALIDYAVQMGILSETKGEKELISMILDTSTDFTRSSLSNLSYDQLIEVAERLGLDTRGTAQIWKDNADYYPFYSKMQDDTLDGPKIAGGFIAGNPLGIKIKGSESAIQPAPLEAISRNALSIVAAAMKNSGLAKMLTTFEAAGMAELITDMNDAKGINVIPVYINGEKLFYRVADREIIHGLQALGMNDLSGIMKFLAMPATFLRDMVTRDPGFMLVNMMRDTMSAFVTSGADFKPFIDTFKNFNADFTELERWGVLGGYDFSNDEMDIVKFIQKEMRKQGIGVDGSMNAKDQFLKVWDYLGEQTGKSDGATRKGVYDVIYQQTGSQREAAYQALEVINFSRRGADPLFRVITAAIPFLNARIQGLDLLYRGGSGQYSAVRSQLEGTSTEIARQIQVKMLTRGGMLMFLTALYYALVSDDEEYQKLSLEERDDNWVIPLGEGIPALKIPIPFEVGTIFKVIPERFVDVMMGGDLPDLVKSYTRQAKNTLKIDPLGFQAIKPIVEVVNNRSTYTGSEIIPYYMREGLEPSAQSRYGTNELARLIGEQLNISPIKLEYIMQGYGGTLGGYLLTMIDASLRQATDRDFLSPRIDQMPVLKRFFTKTEFGRGLEQQFYDLRKESNMYVQTLSALKKQNRIKEAKALMANRKGVAKTRSQVLALNRWLSSWRDRRDRVLNSDLSSSVKKEMLEQMQLQKSKRLAYVPKLREQSELPVRFFN